MWKLVLLLAVFLWMTKAKKFSIKLRIKNHHPAAKSNKTLGPLMDVYGSKMHVSHHNAIYEAFISLGTPPKTFSVMMDTGSDVLWVPHVGCINQGNLGERCGTDEVYNETNSETAVDTKEPFKINYDVGSAEGTYYRDVLAFGGAEYPENMLKFKNPVTFGAADRTVDGDQGMLGLSFAAYNERGTNIFEQAVSEGLMDDAVFTVLYKKCPPLEDSCEDGGMITFGEHDKSLCGLIIGYVPINPNTLRWEFMLDELSVGSYNYKVQTTVMTDTGASYFFLGQTVYENIVAAINAQPYGTDGDLHLIPCDSKLDIKLEINGIRYTIPTSAITVQADNENNCWLMMSPQNDNDVWNLGHPWVRSYCHIHYWKDRKIGFANPL